MKIIFLGPPGVGKGTVAKRILKELDAIQISTGDLLREAVKNNSELGIEAKRYMDQGELVPDELVIKLINEKIKDINSFILDGFPRTIPQAEALDKVMNIDKVVSFEASDDNIIQRLSGRRTCEKCGAIFHITNIPSKEENICDFCKGNLIQRNDDKPESIKKRLEVYKEQTEPLIKYYSDKNKLISINTNNRELNVIVEETLSLLKQNKKEE